VAATVLLTLRGTPFLYAGEELGLLDADVPLPARVDPGGRDGCRAPIPWDEREGHGWAAAPWLPWPPEPASTNVEASTRDGASILHLYRRLLMARRESPALHSGDWAPLDAPPGVLAFGRTRGEDRRQVWANFGDDAVAGCGDPRGWAVEVSSTGDRNWDGRLGPAEAVVLRPG
jgi:alpha-glucosidase